VAGHDRAAGRPVRNCAPGWRGVAAGRATDRNFQQATQKAIFVILSEAKNLSSL
jgi:hypothetical protein